MAVIGLKPLPKSSPYPKRELEQLGMYLYRVPAISASGDVVRGLPKNTLIVGIGVKVTTDFTAHSYIKFGDGTTADKYAKFVSPTLGQANMPAFQWVMSEVTTAATDIYATISGTGVADIWVIVRFESNLQDYLHR